ncbi:MAG: hypothetical protein IPK85_01980 [Gemmatimonadetes bacterium]|nr:hypothetical protein [Gemmatimonadota bacterium]
MADIPALKWRPIAEAPMDGTPIIGTRLRARYSDERFLAIVWWQAEFDAWIAGAREMCMHNGYTFEDGSARRLHSPDIREPDHWVPWPQDPAHPSRATPEEPTDDR